MKSILYISFFVLFSLSWIGCEGKVKVKATAENDTETVLEDAFKSSRTEFEKTINELQATINEKIAEAEKELEAASDDAKVEINVRLDGLRKQRNDLERLAKRIGDATAEGWADLERESAQVVADIKAALNK